MTTGRINQVACRAARVLPTQRGNAHDPQRHRPSDGPARNTRAATPKWTSPHARLAPNRAGCSTCVRSVLSGLGSHARPLSRESRRARSRNRRRRAPRERSADGRRTESPLRPAEHPLATRGAQHTETHATPDRRAPHWQGSKPEQRGRHASIQFSKARSRLRPRGGPCCAGPSAPQPNGGSRRGRPLHALACTRRLRTVAKPFTQFQDALARARPAQWEPGARGRRDFRNTGPRAAARPEPLAVPSTLARRRPAAPAVGPRRRSRLAARALDRFATNMPAQTPSGARVAALQQALSQGLQQRCPN